MNSPETRVRARVLILLGSVLLLLTGTWLFHRRPVAIEPRATAPSAEPRPDAARPDARTRSAMSAPDRQSTAAAPGNLDPLQTAAEGLNVSLNFWGKAVDPMGTPLSAVTVRARIRKWQLMGTRNIFATFEKTNLLTGTDGRFVIGGARGDVLTIEALEKAGYEAEPGALRGYGYNSSARFTPDPKHPVVFRMWPQASKEPLVSGEKVFNLTPDARIYTLDLLKGSLKEGADDLGHLQVWIQRPLDVKFGQKYEWAFGLRAIHGGLCEELDQASSMWLAPETGYNPAYEWKQPSTPDGWSDGVANKRFFVKVQNGQICGRIAIEVYSQYGSSTDGRFLVNYAVNPSGSRILR